jgi:hypothetical protein
MTLLEMVRSAFTRRSRSAGVRAFFHDVGASGVACLQRRTAQVMSSVWIGSAAHASGRPISAAAVQCARQRQRQRMS